ncbi:MAG: hypothetical protein ACYDHC_02100, partial [Desulfuromonadaceae bacterium]
MQKLIKNSWCRKPGGQYAKIGILNHSVHPEGLDIDRLRFYEPGRLEPKRDVGHIISVLRGGGSILVDGENKSPFRLTEGVHLYIPPGKGSVLNGALGTELLCVSGADPSQGRGKNFLLRDETFIAACAAGSHSLRWNFT